MIYKENDNIGRQFGDRFEGEIKISNQKEVQKSIVQVGYKFWSANRWNEP